MRPQCDARLAQRTIARGASSARASRAGNRTSAGFTERAGGKVACRDTCACSTAVSCRGRHGSSTCVQQESAGRRGATGPVPRPCVAVPPRGQM